MSDTVYLAFNGRFTPEVKGRMERALFDLPEPPRVIAFEDVTAMAVRVTDDLVTESDARLLREQVDALRAALRNARDVMQSVSALASVVASIDDLLHLTGGDAESATTGGGEAADARARNFSNEKSLQTCAYVDPPPTTISTAAKLTEQKS